MESQDDPVADLNLLQASLSALMTRFVLTRCPRIASSIREHIDLILAHPGVSGISREVLEYLTLEWREIHDTLIESARCVRERRPSSSQRTKFH